MDEDQITLKGLLTQSKTKYLNVAVTGCDQKNLEEGVTCATEKEQDEYLHGLVFTASIKTNYVAYEDIDRPIRSHLY